MNNGSIAFAAIVGLVLVAIAASIGITLALFLGREVPPTLAAIGVLAIRELVTVVNTYTRGKVATDAETSV